MEYQQFVEWLKTVSIAEVESILKENDTAMAETSPIGEVNLNLLSNIEATLDQHEIGNERKPLNVRISHYGFLFRNAVA
jgi:hypothetical protein